MKTSLILVGAGRGERYGQPKLMIQLGGKPLVLWSLELDTKLDCIDEIVLVVQNEQVNETQEWLEAQGLGSVSCVAGGESRLESVVHGLEAAQGEVVMIHNVANPFAAPEDFEALHKALLHEDCAAFVGQPVVDTLRRIDGEASETIDRQNMWRVQTPQAFRKETLLNVIAEQVVQQGKDQITDEIMLYEKAGLPIRAFATDPMNQKLTFSDDAPFFEQWLERDTLMGIGEDSHAFGDFGTMVIGGLQVKELPKLKGNSDGDLILHALYNAISSALGKRSIGPTADPMAEQGMIDSSAYLEVVLQQMKSFGYQLGNVSISLECSRPKIEPLVDQLKKNLSELLELDPERIGITATTGEELSSFGRGEGVHCTAVVLLQHFR